jgi:hypothetical protein
MRSWTLAVLLATLAGVPLPAVSAASAAPLGLAWGEVAEPAREGALTPGQVAEHLEFLQAHGFRAVKSGDLAAASGAGERSVLLSFDDPASALLYIVPLLDLYRMPAVVTVGPAQAADPALAPVLKGLAASPWVELLPRVERDPGAETGTEVRCTAEAVDPARREAEGASRLRATLEAQVSRLRALTGAAPGGVAWAPGAWSGPAEGVAASLGLAVQLPTFTNMPPALEPPRVARYAMPSWAGIWAPVQASVHWDPRDHPVRFAEVDAAWVCAGGAGGAPARVARIVEVVRRLGLNGVRLLPGGPAGAWFATAAAPVRGDVVGPLARTLREAGVRWTIVDLPAPSGDPGRDRALAADLARAVDLDVAVLPDATSNTAGPEDRLGQAVLAVRPAARLAWRDTGGDGAAGERAFRLAPQGPDRPASRGLTVHATTPAAADAAAAGRAIAGWEWIGLPVELAEAGLRTSLRSLAAFALSR